jgi:hypothetical protein
MLTSSIMRHKCPIAALDRKMELPNIASLCVPLPYQDRREGRYNVNIIYNETQMSYCSHRQKDEGQKRCNDSLLMKLCDCIVTTRLVPKVV